MKCDCLEIASRFAKMTDQPRQEKHLPHHYYRIKQVWHRESSPWQHILHGDAAEDVLVIKVYVNRLLHDQNRGACLSLSYPSCWTEWHSPPPQVCGVWMHIQARRRARTRRLLKLVAAAVAVAVRVDVDVDSAIEASTSTLADRVFSPSRRMSTSTLADRVSYRAQCRYFQDSGWLWPDEWVHLHLQLHFIHVQRQADVRVACRVCHEGSRAYCRLQVSSSAACSFSLLHSHLNKQATFTKHAGFTTRSRLGGAWEQEGLRVSLWKR